MFAGLPGIGVGTLFYVVTALWMPVRELARTVRGDFSAARWRLAVVQFSFALSIIASIALADRALTIALDDGSIRSLTPARLLNDGLASHVPQSIWAAPIMASLLLLAAVLVTTEALRWMVSASAAPPVRGEGSGGEDARFVAQLVEDEP
jgi:hypothetical protein